MAELALTISGDNELITTDASAVAVQTDIGQVAQAITPVELIACIYQNILNIQTLLEIVISKNFAIVFPPD